ncbi:peroxiredoxin family protein [Maribacter sp. 2210JD10-5]|uniref:peroxiredoxin family protein n=1 Tax=Maribacter sp. 2210JD10-5 TaxID=3386272 RepID=UPI0039BC72A8
MKNLLLFIGLILIFFSCKQEDKSPQLKEGIWQARLLAMDNAILPFNFKVDQNEEGSYLLEIYNAEEIIKVDEISILGDSIIIKTPVFEGYIAGTFTSENIKGEFIKESLDRVVPFEAEFGITERFNDTKPSNTNISGVWETEFNPSTPDSYMGKGIFIQNEDKVTGTFRTTTGDYRYLEGVVDEDSLKISAFDGAHAFVFTAKATDSILNGNFYSGNHSKEPFVGKRNETYELPSPDSLTFIKEGYKKLEFTFPDSPSTTITLSDEQFKDKVVIVQIMGTWCPNCLDETKFLSTYLNENQNEDLKVIGLAFEYAKTSALAFKSINRLKESVGVKYPILLAQYGTSDKKMAQQKLPMLNHILSYPTTIFIDKKGTIRKIHTGFNGPATGDKYTEFKGEFDDFVKQLLAE